MVPANGASAVAHVDETAVCRDVSARRGTDVRRVAGKTHAERARRRDEIRRLVGHDDAGVGVCSAQSAQAQVQPYYGLAEEGKGFMQRDLAGESRVALHERVGDRVTIVVDHHGVEGRRFSSSETGTRYFME